MKYRIHKQSGAPVYEQLYQQLREDIVSGALPRGAKLPSKRLLAGELNLSVVTVEHTFALLCDEGYAESRPRSGYYVSYGDGVGAPPARPPAPLETMRAGRAAPEDFPFSVWARTMRAVLSDYDRRILDSSPSAGCLELREAIAGYLERSRGLRVSPERLVVGSGAEYLYGLTVQLLGRDRGYALEDPCYDKIRRVYEANGARCELLRMGEDGILSEDLAESRAEVLHVTPFHSYPSGVTATAAKRREYARWARERSGFIIEDDYDAEFASLTRQIETICSLAPERVLYINTFSKILAPSVRTGFLVLPEELMAEYREKLDFYSCTVPVFDQLVLAEFIRQGRMEQYINRRRRKLRQG